MNSSSQQQHYHNQYYTWPDPRGKWPESAKKTLKDLLIRGKSNQTHPSSQPPQNINSMMMKEEPNSQQQQQQQNPLAGVGLTSGSSDFNFSSSSSSASSSKGVASVAAFLTYAAQKMITSSSSQQTVEKDLHECTLMFIADLLEVACGPAGPACVKVKFPSDDPTGTNFYKQFSEKNGVRVTTVENFRAAGNLMSSVEQIEANNNNNNNNLQNSASKKKNAVQMTVSSSICLVKNPNNTNNSNNSFVVVDRWGAEAQQQAIHYYNQHQNLVQTTAGAAQRRGRQSAVNSTYNQQDGGSSSDEDIRNPTSVLFGFFAMTVACSSCPFDGLRALLCRRPALHQLPCSVLLIFFASLPKILKQYDFVRGQPAGLDNNNPMNNTNNNSSHKRGPPKISEILPMGLPFPMQLFDGEDHNSQGIAQWEWLWSRVTVLNRLLSEGSESYARVM